MLPFGSLSGELALFRIFTVNEILARTCNLDCETLHSIPYTLLLLHTARGAFAEPEPGFGFRQTLNPTQSADYRGTSLIRNRPPPLGPP